MDSFANRVLHGDQKEKNAQLVTPAPQRELIVLLTREKQCASIHLRRAGSNCLVHAFMEEKRLPGVEKVGQLMEHSKPRTTT